MGFYSPHESLDKLVFLGKLKLSGAAEASSAEAQFFEE